ncbi:MAG: hypothetical protein JXP34_03080 [Planctomycetes bacterium]|nr:hypothetical protein [Planctomycetota bacterium]
MSDASAGGISGRYGFRPRTLRLCLAGGVAGVIGTLVLILQVGGAEGVGIGAGVGGLALGLLLFAFLASEVVLAPDRIRRTTLLGTREIPWERVQCIQVVVVSSKYGTNGVVVLIGRDMPRVRFKVEQEELDPIRIRLSERCPRAFVEDQRTGTIAPPREGEPREIRRGAEVIFDRARRYYRWIAILWFIAGAIGAVSAVFLAVAAFWKGKYEAIIACVFLAILSLPPIPLGKSWLARIGVARESLRQYLDLEDRTEG